MELSFSYRARDAGGAEQRGVRAGASAQAVAADLNRLGWTPLEIRPQAGQAAPARPPAIVKPAAGAARGAAEPAASAAASATAPARRWPWQRGIGKATHVSFGLALRELSALLRAGIPLMRALDLAAETAADAQVKRSLRAIVADLDSGLALTQAAENEMRGFGLISAYDVAMLRVGEKTGRLPECFADMHHHREFQMRTQSQVVAALRYPLFVMLTCLLAMVIVNVWVIPSFAKVFAAARTELPLLTRVLMGSSSLMVKSWPYLAAVSAAAVFAWLKWTSSVDGRLWWDRVKLRLPIVGSILMGVQMARLSSSLASSIAAGLTISDALVVSAHTLGNRFMESRVQQMCGDLARGTSIAWAARNMGVLPNTMLQMFAIGEESGSLDALMREISVHYQAEVDQSVARLSETIEPLMIWIMGAGVLVLALGIFMPMWDLGSATLK
ncbi:MAG: type II secretion system F family protein [Rubrivivax sp.]|nr:type II secretion system F family protein [Rubrivivax sp.]